MNAAPNLEKDLLARAEAALASAYAPYSGVRVGAALLTRDGRIFTGVNVENTSLGLTICAERNAVAAAVAAGALASGRGRDGVAVMLVFTSNSDHVRVPCGACRQVLSELAPGAAVIFGRNGRILKRWPTVAELLPEAFDGRWKKGKGP